MPSVGCIGDQVSRLRYAFLNATWWGGCFNSSCYFFVFGYFIQVLCFQMENSILLVCIVLLLGFPGQGLFAGEC